LFFRLPDCPLASDALAPEAKGTNTANRCGHHKIRGRTRYFAAPTRPDRPCSALGAAGNVMSWPLPVRITTSEKLWSWQHD
jgi:hypothetical protein